jgi:hypothetical protein
VHGDEDETVLISSGEAIAKVAKKAVCLPIHGGNHVFNTPNPFPIDGEPSKQLQEVHSAVLEIIAQL